jgi:hypothetical protein
MDLNNYDIYTCDKCGEVIMIVDVKSLNKATSHAHNCVCNAKIIKSYNNELKSCTNDIDRKIVHAKYIKLL